jgi:two-component system OmpR family sensor kinase
VRVETDIAPGALNAWVDPRRMGQVLETLVHDSAVHSPGGSVVRVRVRAEDEDWVEVEVVDASDRSADSTDLFQPFARIDPEPHGRRGDLGLGLPLAQRLVLAHGGLLKVAPAQPRGLRLVVLLPRQNIMSLEGRDAASLEAAA